MKLKDIKKGFCLVIQKSKTKEIHIYPSGYFELIVDGKVLKDNKEWFKDVLND